MAGESFTAETSMTLGSEGSYGHHWLLSSCLQPGCSRLVGQSKTKMSPLSSTQFLKIYEGSRLAPTSSTVLVLRRLGL